jgi:serine/threonine protein kinase
VSAGTEPLPKTTPGESPDSPSDRSSTAPEATIDWADRPARAAPDSSLAGQRPNTGEARIGAGGGKPKTLADGADPTAAPGAKARTQVDSGATARPLGGDVPPVLGGYQILMELGRGGMGAVYLARQLSLDRKVAVKVMKRDWARDPRFLARFTREAYAAAQLVHHNVVQIHDIGHDKGIPFFSMEYVEGRSLGALIRDEGKLDPEVAVGYALQAARGLKFAHDQGMVHRDVKPDNLLLNDHGIVKVADLGLVKVPSAPSIAPAQHEMAAGEAQSPKLGSGSLLASTVADVTLANLAMGTAAYMAPEQAVNASGVDGRADMYSLGCTLYVLLTGKPPFSGTTALEVISKHRLEPMIPPDAVVKRVPKALSEVIMRMVAKKPDDRYHDLGEVIQSFERFLGFQPGGRFSPKEEHADLLEESVNAFNAAGAALVRRWLIVGFLAVCGLGFLGSLAVWPLLAPGFLIAACSAGAAYFIQSGLARKTFLFSKVRELVLGSALIDWAAWAAGALLLVGLLWLMGLLWAAAGFAVLGAGCGLILFHVFDRQVTAQREEPLARTERMLRDMRLAGLDEEELRQFVCKYAGEKWEPFYEALFGFEARLQARERWGRGPQGVLRPRYAVWREPLVRWIEKRLADRRASRERKLLCQVEEEGLKAKGLSSGEARTQARAAAQAMVGQAAELKSAATVPAERRAALKTLLEMAERPPSRAAAEDEGWVARLQATPVAWLAGPPMRFLLGAALIAGSVLWMNHNGLIPGQELQDLVRSAQQDPTEAGINEVAADAKALGAGWLERYRSAVPLAVPLVGQWISGFSAAAAGTLLLLSTFVRGIKVSFLLVPAVVLLVWLRGWFGEFAGIPGDAMCAGIGLAVGFVALWLGRER